MKLLLINPPMVSGDKPGYHHLSPPLGIMYLAGFLKNKGMSVDILDLVIDNETKPVDYVSQTKPDVVGITSMTGNFPFGLKIAGEIKSKFDIPIVFGGPHSTILPREVLQNEVIDYVVMGEGEYTLYDLLKSLKEQIGLNSIKGLGYKRNGELILNEERNRVEDMDSIPFPAYDLINNEAYISYGAKFMGFRHIVMILSRGCPGRCTFCAQNLTMGRKFRAFSPKRAVDEIEVLLDKYDAEGIWFKDSEFNMNRNWTLEFCDEILRRRLKFKWTCLTRADGIDMKLAQKLKEAGLEQVWIGAESGSDRVMREVLNKEISVAKVKRAFEACKSVGLKTSAFFMMGLPTETKEEVRLTFELIKELDSRPMQIAIYHPLPGTVLYDTYHGEEVVRNATLDEMSFDRACMPTGPLSKEEVQIAYDEIINYFMGNGKEPVFLYS